MLTGLLLGIENRGDAVAPGADALLQYGAPGAVAFLFVAVAYKLFNNLETTRNAAIQRVEAAYEKEVTRGDRLEKELADLNKLINTSLAGELVRATDAIREALEIMHDHRRQ